MLEKDTDRPLVDLTDGINSEVTNLASYDLFKLIPAYRCHTVADHYLQRQDKCVYTEGRTFMLYIV